MSDTSERFRKLEDTQLELKMKIKYLESSSHSKGGWTQRFVYIVAVYLTCFIAMALTELSWQDALLKALAPTITFFVVIGGFMFWEWRVNR